MSSGSPDTTNVTGTCQRNNSGDENSGATTGSEPNDNNDSNTQRSRTSSNARRTDSRKNVLSSNERTWEGDTPEIGAVLGLRTEYLNKKTTLRVFMEKMEEYLLRNWTMVVTYCLWYGNKRILGSVSRKNICPKSCQQKTKRAKLKLRSTNKGSKCR